jgi:hypothetical protein
MSHFYDTLVYTLKKNVVSTFAQHDGFQAFMVERVVTVVSTVKAENWKKLENNSEDRKIQYYRQM